MNKKAQKDKENLVRRTLDDLGNCYTPGLYIMMEEHFPELNDRFNARELKIHSIVQSGTEKELKKALEGYWYLHMELIGRTENLKKVG